MSRPIIGVVANFFDRKLGHYIAHSRLNIGYSDSIMRAGGLPVILPVIDDVAAMDQFLDTVSGVVFGGGYDVDPARYGQERHERTQTLPSRLETYIFRMFERVDRRPDMPAIGICLGCQVFNVARGGTLHQHIPDVPAAPSAGRRNHFAEATQYAGGRESHAVRVQPGTRLAEALEWAGLDAAFMRQGDSQLGDDRSVLPGAKAGANPSHSKEEIEVNSGHHQAIDRLGQGLVASAISDDGIIEAVEDPAHRMLLGVQWHPEELSDRPEHLALFAALVNAAAQR